jgi:hypothetical protein
LINSSISAHNGRFVTIDLKDFCLNTIMPNCECIRICFKDTPKELADATGWAKCVDDKGCVCFTASGGTCGLPQAGELAADQLEKFLALHGFIPAGRTPGLWKHTTRDILFTLVVDGFGARCAGRSDADHLVSTRNKGHKTHVDWKGGCTPVRERCSADRTCTRLSS